VSHQKHQIKPTKVLKKESARLDKISDLQGVLKDFTVISILYIICAQSMTHFLASHEKMCQISYKISLFWMVTMVARKMSQTLGTSALYEKLNFWSKIALIFFHFSDTLMRFFMVNTFSTEKNQKPT
jgi:hypothetical protein